MADETLPIRIVETTTTTNEVGQRVSVLPARYVDADTAVDENGRPIETIPFEEVEGLITLNSAGQAVPVIPVRIVDTVTALTETGTSVLALALRGAGGTPTPPFAFPEDEMLLGMGFQFVNSSNGYYPFANIMPQATAWAKVSGTAVWTQEWGVITHPNADGATDRYRAQLNDVAWANLPAGVYTVRNPDGLKIGIGAFSTQNLAAFTTATSFTFTYAQDQLLAIHAEGPVTNINGPIEIILPDCVTTYDAGDLMNPAFMAFHEPGSAAAQRFMDWLVTYQDLSEEPADLPTGIPMMFRAPWTQLKAKVPFEYIIHIANRLEANPWINISARASGDLVAAMANKIKLLLSPSLYAYLEFGNEIWNPGSGFNDAREWTRHFFNARYEAVPNGSNGWLRVGHGLTTGDLVANFFHRDNFKRADNLTVYPMGYGVLLYVERIDDDNFKLYRNTGTESVPVMGTVVNVDAGMEKLLYKKHAGDGPGAVNVDVNYGIRSKQVWDIFDGILGRNRCIHILGTQLVNSSVTTTRLAQTGVAAATDGVAIALYYHGEFWGVSIDIASGQITPKGWAQLTGNSIRVAVYANGSTPTKAEVLAGTGTGYIDHEDIAISSTNAATMTAAAAITGLSNGTDYECFAVLTEPTTGYTWMASQGFTASASASTITFTDSDEQMAMRARRNINYWASFLPAQKAAAGSIPLLTYECNHDYRFNGAGATPSQIIALRANWMASTVHAEVFAMMYTTLAASDLKLGLQFGDINYENDFNLATGLQHLDDPKREAFMAFAGTTPATTPLSIGNVVATDVQSEPSFPHVVHTFADPTLTYQLFNDDGTGNYEVVGDELIMVGDIGINWSAPVSHKVKVEARNASTSTIFDVDFATGFAWYEADAQFAWNSVADNDNAAINPVIGGSVALVTGSGATIAGGMWDMDGNVYRELSTALTARLDDSKPILVAAVLDEDNHATNFVSVFQIGNANFIRLALSGSNQPRFDWWNGTVSGQIRAQEAAMTAGKKVYWAYYDPATNQLRAGVNQTENTTHGPQSYTYVDDVSRGVTVGSESTTARSQMKHGSLQVVNRAGLTLSGALAIVAKMQTLHGI